MAKSLNSSSAYYFAFRNLSMTAYMIETQKSKFTDIFSLNFTNLSQVAKLNSPLINMYIEWIGSGGFQDLRKSFGFEKIISIKT